MQRLLWLCLFFGVLMTHPAVAQEATHPASDLARLLAEASSGDRLVIDGGVLAGPLEIDKTVTLIGRNWPVIDGGETGTVLKITAADVHLEGFVIRRSGRSLEKENSGIAVEAPGAQIIGNRLEDTLFGIYLREADESLIRGNVISSVDVDVPRRGDAIRVWYSNRVVIENNAVARGRDVVLWYSEHLRVRGNSVQDGRYGLHFMYCDDAIVEENLLYGNSVGAFMMYSRRIRLQHNTIASNRGPSGFGIGLKDMDDAVVEDNLILDNRLGVHLDNSPREIDSVGQFKGNVFGYNDVGVSLLPSVRHNHFFANSFIENEEQVAIEGGGRMPDNVWAGNYWSDYAGYDAGGDGVGDMPYRADRLFEQLMDKRPLLRLFVYSPAASAADFAARAFPLVRPQPKLVDDAPLMAPVVPAGAPMLPAGQSQPLWPLIALVTLAIGVMGWPWLRRPGRRLFQPCPEDRVTEKVFQ